MKPKRFFSEEIVKMKILNICLFIKTLKLALSDEISFNVQIFSHQTVIFS